MGTFPAKHASVLVVSHNENGIHNQFSCHASEYRSQIDTAPMEKAYEGGLERIAWKVGDR